MILNSISKHGETKPAIKYAILDVESTIFEKGNPFAQKNKLCLVGVRITYEDETKEDRIYKIQYDEEPYGEALAELGRTLDSVNTVVGFNLKFDLNWLARYGIRLLHSVRIFDCQLGDFILSAQSTPYPSLDECLSKYGLPLKSNIVATEYWDNGIDTTEVPLDVLTNYLRDDLDRTDQLFQCGPLQALFRGESLQGILCKLHLQDLRVLQEMEFNGLLFDWAGMGTSAKQLEAELEKINGTILSFVPERYKDYFNTGSGDHLSLLLYGGNSTHRVGTEYQHIFKGGKQAGQTVTRYRWEDLRLDFPRLVTPPDGSQLKKEGFFSVDEDTLKSIKTDKISRVLVEALLARAEKEKLLGTYYHGIPKVAAKYDWQDNLIHGTYNQCRVVTGRLSSEKPNQQNRPAEIDRYVVTRFGTI